MIDWVGLKTGCIVQPKLPKWWPQLCRVLRRSLSKTNLVEFSLICVVIQSLNLFRLIRTCNSSFESPMGKVHGLVVPLCRSGWDRLDWDRFHRGYRACPATGTGLQRGYMTCPWDRNRPGLFWPFPGTGLVQAACLYHWDKHNLSHWDRHSACPTGTGCACPSGTGLVQVPPFQSQHLTKFKVVPYQKTKGVLIEFQKFLIKSRSEIGWKSRLKIGFVSLD